MTGEVQAQEIQRVMAVLDTAIHDKLHYTIRFISFAMPGTRYVSGGAFSSIATGQQILTSFCHSKEGLSL
jgi:hypothetical protein